ncbi:hypothetical protein [Thiovibrio frasassiensis]|uniref:Uncharacterized protein n=1 Tax=Thiovibrio frasassiensis TaxID=2984131 RepID=A0A9X4MFJ8_9BACT|nr:hypothetical protein [Thiovibrio frasassiensis]MDG4475722.1 hypothetical protein [Thiovibrio frasassiensis]
MSAKLPLFFLLLFLYGALFSLQESRFSEGSLQLSHPLHPTAQKIALGYLHQLGGEAQFIKASVFFGGLSYKPSKPLEYAEPLSRRLNAAAALHPQFIDTYFLCQATLPHINDEYARYTNRVISQGMTALPDNFVLPFFVGFNHFYYLDEPLEAAQLFHLAAKKPNGPIMLEHLANILSAEGGNIYAALIGLRGLYANEKDEQVKKRYAEEITAFEKAVTVLEAIQRHEKMTGAPPAALSDLVPNYLPAIPDIGPIFTLEWQPPHLGVVRVDKKKVSHR